MISKFFRSRWALVTSALSMVLAVTVTGCGAPTNAQSTTKSATSAQSTWDAIEARGTLVVGTDGTYYPVTYRDVKTGQLTGFDVEVVKEMAKRLNLKPVFKTMDFDGILPSLRNGQIDIAANDFDITPARQKIFDFTVPFDFDYGTAIVRSSDDSGIHTVAELKGKKIGGTATDNFSQFARTQGADVIVYSGGSDTILHDVIDGRIDAMLNSHTVLVQTLKKFNDPRVKLANIQFDPSQEGFVMEKGSPELQAHLDTVLKQMLADGTIKKISEQFFQTDVTKQPTKSSK